jgi:glycerol kinase
MPSLYYLAIDQGGQSSRVAVYTQVGEQVCCFSAPCATQHQKPANSLYEHIEQNGEEILAGIVDCLQKIHAQLGDEIQHIKGAGFAGQGSSLLCWNNQTGEALTPVLSWQDIRGEPYLKEIPLTHLQAQQLTGLRVSPHYGASKIRWCLEHTEKVKDALSKNVLSIGPIVSYLFWHLLGKKSVVDPGHAQRTLLWNLQKNNWDQSLLDLFQIPRSVLPSCQHHNSHFGNLQLGNYSIPFTASARDQGASLFARSLPDNNTCYINIGTGAFIQRVSENLQAPEGLLVSPLWLPETKSNTDVIEVSSPTCYLSDVIEATTSLYAWEATVNGAASAISYMQQQTGLEITPEQINHALTLNPQSDCYFLNAIGGLSAPYWRTDLQPQFSENLNPNEKILAWIESVIFQIVVNVELMNQLGKVEKIIISGGFSKSDVVCQKIADLTQAKVHRSDNADATLQGIGCMATELSENWQPSIVDEVFVPHMNEYLVRRFQRWGVIMRKWLA